MKTFILASASILASLQLAACGGQGDDALGEQVEDKAEAQAKALESRADNLEMQAKQLDDMAEEIQDTGDQRSDAIDAADVMVDDMTPEERQAIIDGEAPAVE